MSDLQQPGRLPLRHFLLALAPGSFVFKGLRAQHFLGGPAFALSIFRQAEQGLGDFPASQTSIPASETSQLGTSRFFHKLFSPE
jgi:hypothetical protein